MPILAAPLLKVTLLVISFRLGCKVTLLQPSVEYGGHAPPLGMITRLSGLRPAIRVILCHCRKLLRISIFDHISSFLVTDNAVKIPHWDPNFDSNRNRIVILAMPASSNHLPSSACRVACLCVGYCRFQFCQLSDFPSSDIFTPNLSFFTTTHLDFSQFLYIFEGVQLQPHCHHRSRFRLRFAFAGLRYLPFRIRLC